MARILNSTTSEAGEANNYNADENNNVEGNENFSHTVLFVTLITYASLSLLFVLKTKCKIFLSGHQSLSHGTYNSPTHRYRSSYYPIPKPHTRFFLRLRRWFHRVTSWQDHSLIFPIPDQFQLDESNHQSWSVLQVAHWVHSKLILSTQQKPINQQRISYYANNNNERVLVSMNSTPTTTSSICGYSTSSHEGRYRQLLGDPGDEQIIDDEYRNNMAIHSTIQILMKQRIDGASLQHLSLDRLNNFGVPFGIALQIIFHLENLIPEFSRQDLEMAKVTAEGGLPSWYENAENTNGSRLGKSGDNSIGNPNANDCNNEDQNAITERAQQLMKDRFGISLPSIRNENEHNQYQEVDNDTDDDQIDIENGELDMSSKTRQLSSLPPNRLEIDRGIHDECGGNHHSRLESNYGQGNSSSISNVLNSMPPHIRAAAARRPDLVEKLMSDKRQQQQQQQQQQLNRFGIEVAPGPTPLPSISESKNDASEAIGYVQGNTSWLEGTVLSIPSGHKQFRGRTRFRSLEIVRSEDDECESNSESVSLLRRISGSKEQ